ncbi:hypothetical protein EP331_02510 [bacterium]|nr:MAG: hypothetical protein EP331_02510 [bacterium]
MIHQFSSENIQEIGIVLGTEPKKTGNVYRLELKDDAGTRKLALEIHVGLEVGGELINMVSVYAANTFIQLHNCTGFVASDLLNQVTFFGKQQELVSGLIIEKEAGCSLYSNVNEHLLSGDFTQLPPEVMMSSVALSLTESIDFEGFSFDEE